SSPAASRHARAKRLSSLTSALSWASMSARSGRPHPPPRGDLPGRLGQRLDQTLALRLPEDRAERADDEVDRVGAPLASELRSPSRDLARLGGAHQCVAPPAADVPEVNGVLGERLGLAAAALQLGQPSLRH